MILTDHGTLEWWSSETGVASRADATNRSEANFRPFEGKARVFLIDEADKFNDNSANALLKVLEEPPSTSHLILITLRPAMLLPTILSGVR